MLTLDHLIKITDKAPNDNMRSFLTGFTSSYKTVGLNTFTRIAHYVPQMAHESMGFRYDREIWDGKGAQSRYEGRKDLGNTVAGDGYLFRGRTGIMITGRSNTGEFLEWCREMFGEVPDFLTHPDMMNTDPWEGLGPIWYWDTRNLNKYADTNNIEMVTRRINGGLNGYEDRLRYYDRTALVLLGHDPDDIWAFQKAYDLGYDGISGPETRGAMHKALVALDSEPVPDLDPLPVIDRNAAVLADLRALIAKYEQPLT